MVTEVLLQIFFSLLISGHLWNQMNVISIQNHQIFLLISNIVTLVLLPLQHTSQQWSNLSTCSSLILSRLHMQWRSLLLEIHLIIWWMFRLFVLISVFASYSVHCFILVSWLESAVHLVIISCVFSLWCEDDSSDLRSSSASLSLSYAPHVSVLHPRDFCSVFNPVDVTHVRRTFVISLSRSHWPHFPLTSLSLQGGSMSAMKWSESCATFQPCGYSEWPAPPLSFSLV